VMLCIR